MNPLIQIQSLKSQIGNMKLQIDNIEMQNYNLLMINNPIVEQLLNLSIQMFNAGIQAFNMGKNMNVVMNISMFYEQLKNIMEQVNSLINENNLDQMMMQQQMMIQPPNFEQQELMQQNIMNDNIKRKNIVFINARSKNYKILLQAKYGTTVEEILQQYMHKEYGSIQQNIYFIFNAKVVKKDEKTVIEDYFEPINIPQIEVVEY